MLSKMKAKKVPARAVLPVVAALAVGVTGGYWAHQPSAIPGTIPAEAGPRTETDESNSTGSALDGLSAAVLGTLEAAGRGSRPGTLIPVPFSVLDREFSLLATLSLTDRAERISDLARSAALENPAAVLALAETKLTPSEAIQFRVRYVARWAQIDTPKAVSWVERQPLASRRELLASVVESWAQRDASAALTFVSRIPESDRRQALLRSAFTGLASVDPERAWALLVEVESRSEREDVSYVVLMAMARKDGGRAAALALNRGGTGRVDFHTQEIIGIWLETDSFGATAWLKSLPPGSQRNQLVSGLAIDLAKNHPETALELARFLPTGSLREQALQSALSQWALRDSEAVLKWANGKVDAGLVRTANLAVIQHFAETDPARAVALLEFTPGLSVNDRQANLSNLARHWAERNPAQALAWAKNLPPGQQLETIPGILAQQAGENPQAALDRARVLSDPRVRRLALQQVVTEWGSQDGAAAAKWLMGQSDRRLATELAPQLIQQIAETDIATAQTLANQMPPGEARTRAIAGMVGGVANTDLPGALSILEKLPAGAGKDEAMQQLAFVWGRQDPTAAAKYALTQPDTDGRSQMLDAAATEWAQRDPEAAATFFKELTPGHGREVFADNLARHWAAADPEAAVKWVTSLAPADRRPDLMANLVGTWAQQSPQDAAAYAGQLPTELQEGAVRSVVQAYAEQDPTTGAKWLSAFPEGELRDSAQAAFVNQWAQTDATAAAQWLRTQPESASRQIAIQEFTRSVSYREPASAWQWAGSVADEGIRQNLQRDAMTRWLRVDPGAAAVALEADQTLPPDLKSELRPKP